MATVRPPRTRVDPVRGAAATRSAEGRASKLYLEAIINCVRDMQPRRGAHDVATAAPDVAAGPKYAYQRQFTRLDMAPGAVFGGGAVGIG